MKITITQSQKAIIIIKHGIIYATKDNFCATLFSLNNKISSLPNSQFANRLSSYLTGNVPFFKSITSSPRKPAKRSIKLLPTR